MRLLLWFARNVHPTYMLLVHFFLDAVFVERSANIRYKQTEEMYPRGTQLEDREPAWDMLPATAATVSWELGR